MFWVARAVLFAITTEFRTDAIKKAVDILYLLCRRKACDVIGVLDLLGNSVLAIYLVKFILVAFSETKCRE